MDAEIKESVLKALMYLRANLTDPHGGRAPLTKITDATVGALDACWGSGRADAPGPNLRELEHRTRKAEMRLGATSSSAWLARQMGVTLQLLREHLPEITAKIRGMRMSGFWAAGAARRLADALDVLQREADADAVGGAPVGPLPVPTDPTPVSA